MNKKYLEENKLYEAHKHFMRLCEWSYVPKSLEEEGDEENQDLNIPNDNGNDPSIQPPMPNQGMDMNQDPNQPPMPQDQGVNGGDDAQMQDMGEPMPPMEEPIGDEEASGEDEEVIDVDELTDAQEEVNDKVNSVGQELGNVDKRIESLLKAIDSMEHMISSNNSQIVDLKKEFEKRNPTQTEKLNLRSLDSYPYNIRPTDYWNNKGADSNYSAYFNNDESPTEEYKITNNDVDDFSEREMADSFYVGDELDQDLKKIFGL